MLNLETPVVWRTYNWSCLNATYNPDTYRTRATTRYLVICHCHCYPTSFQFHLGELLNIWQICHWSYFNATHDRHTYLLVPASIPPAAATISLTDMTLFSPNPAVHCRTSLIRTFHIHSRRQCPTSGKLLLMGHSWWIFMRWGHEVN